VPSLAAASGQLVTGALMLLPLAAFQIPSTVPSWYAIGAVVTLSILGTAVASIIYYWLIAHLGATGALLVTYLLPGFALIWGALFLHEDIRFIAVLGLALVLMGIPPGLEEMARSLVMLAVTIIYAGVWLAVAMLFSIVFRSPATAALITLGLWLFLTILWPLLSPAIAEAFTSPEDPLTALTTRQNLARLSPSTLFGEVVLAIHNPSVRSLGPIFLDQLRGAVVGAPLPFGQSLLVAWPQIVGLLAAAILVFVAGYVAFQRQEVRA